MVKFRIPNLTTTFLSSWVAILYIDFLLFLWFGTIFFVFCNWYFWSLFVWTTNGALSKFEAKIVSDHINSSNAINGKPQPYTKLFIVARALMKTKWINQNSGNKTQPKKKWCCFNLPLTRQRKHIWSHIMNIHICPCTVTEWKWHKYGFKWKIETMATNHLENSQWPFAS